MLTISFLLQKRKLKIPLFAFLSEMSVAYFVVLGMITVRQNRSLQLG